MVFALTLEQQTVRQEIRAFWANEITPSLAIEDGWVPDFCACSLASFNERGLNKEALCW